MSSAKALDWKCVDGQWRTALAGRVYTFVEEDKAAVEALWRELQPAYRTLLASRVAVLPPGRWSPARTLDLSALLALEVAWRCRTQQREPELAIRELAQPATRRLVHEHVATVLGPRHTQVLSTVAALLGTTVEAIHHLPHGDKGLTRKS